MFAESMQQEQWQKFGESVMKIRTNLRNHAESQKYLQREISARN